MTCETPRGIVPYEEAEEALAKRLHFTMERFDPSGSESWELLMPIEREFYRACIRELMIERHLVVTALTRHFPGDGGIHRGAQVPEESNVHD